MSTCFTFFCFPLTFFPFQFFGHYRTYFFFFSLYSFPTCVAFRQSVVANTHDRTSIATLFRITGEVNFHLMRTVTMTTIYKKKLLVFCCLANPPRQGRGSCTLQKNGGYSANRDQTLSDAATPYSQFFQTNADVLTAHLLHNSKRKVNRRERLLVGENCKLGGNGERRFGSYFLSSSYFTKESAKQIKTSTCMFSCRRTRTRVVRGRGW